MADKKRVRKSEVDLILENLSVGEEHPIKGSRRHWQNRQGLLHGKFPKRHVAIMKAPNGSEVQYVAKRVE